jgi:hypothetical protein
LRFGGKIRSHSAWLTFAGIGTENVGFWYFMKELILDPVGDPVERVGRIGVGRNGGRLLGDLPERRCLAAPVD